MCEFIEDLHSRLIADLKKMGITEQTAQMVAVSFVGSIEIDYGGERVYIGKTREDDRREMSQRNRSIIRDWKAGERLPLLARRYGISTRQVRRVVMG